MEGVYKIQKTINIEHEKLSTILDMYRSKINLNNIDFMSIDIEGLEYEVLSSNNWKIYRPKYLLIEILDLNINRLHNSKIYKLLKRNKYNLVGKTKRTCFFKLNANQLH